VEAGTESLPPTPQLGAHQATPAAVRLGADVGQDNVGVQVRVAGVVGHVLERRSHHPFGRHLLPACTQPCRTLF
jgi:hypothetical protein